MSSIESTSTHYSHRSFVSLADFNMDPLDAGSVNLYETSPYGRDSGLNSLVVRSIGRLDFFHYSVTI
jgi:hypothetical protein